MSSTAEAWETGRPIYSRLPGINGGYTDNAPADWLTDFWDGLLVALKGKIDDLPRQLNPDTCDPDWLDFLAPLCGFTGEYWDKAWSEDRKRSLLRNSYTLIWSNKGSEAVLSFLLDTFDINHEIWLGDSFLLGVTELPGTLGSPEWQYYILLPLQYLRESVEFRLVEKLNRLYGPVFADSTVAYDAFYCGFSVCGDPIFEA